MTERFKRNLVIVHTPDAQQISDWLTIAETIAVRAPEIDVRIVENGKPHPDIANWQMSRPSLVFSACTLSRFEPAGGKVYTGRAIDKLEQVRRMAAAGIPTPRSVPLTPDLALNAADWGAYVLVKPRSEKFWAGMMHKLARPETIGSRYMELTRNGSVEMIVQTLIDTRDEAGCLHAYRVLTFFGRPLYCNHRRHLAPRPPLTEIHDRASNLTAHNAKTGHDGKPLEVEIASAGEPEVLELAVSATRAFSEVPVLALDIVRERSTGSLYVLEVNPGGRTWHLSSFVAFQEPPENRRRKYEQFGALDIAADALIERTREEAT